MSHQQNNTSETCGRITFFTLQCKETPNNINDKVSYMIRIKNEVYLVQALYECVLFNNVLTSSH